MQIAFTAHPLPDIRIGNQPSFFFNPDFYRAKARELGDCGFSGLVVDDSGGLLSNLDLTADVGRHTEGIAVVATHWPGVVSPTISARQLAYLDRLVGGRLSLRIAIDQAWDGGRNGVHEAACRRVDEYLTLLKRLWANDRPIDHEGEFYSLREGFVSEKGPQGLSLPIRMHGRTGSAIQVAARHATLYEAAFGTIGDVAGQVERVRAAARSFGRADKIGFALAVPMDNIAMSIRAGGRSAAANVAISLLPFAELGVNEFVITGFASNEVLRMIGTDVATILENSLDRRSSSPLPQAAAEGAGQLPKIGLN